MNVTTDTAVRAALAPLGVVLCDEWVESRDRSSVRCNGRYGVVPVVICFAAVGGEQSIGVYPSPMEINMDGDIIHRACMMGLYKPRGRRWAVTHMAVAEYLSGRI